MEVVQGKSFRHVLIRPSSPRAGRELHVYIEGDGSPYDDRYTIAKDPTPRHPVALQLAAEDTEPVLYVGRPCYFGLEHDPGCGPSYWTLRRFSPEVVDSLVAVLRSELSRSTYDHVTVVGFSGGGTLAVLVADQVSAVDRVITVAGNLDIDEWACLHGYSPLTGSINPAANDHRRLGLTMIHYVGGADQIVPPALISAAAGRIGGSVIVIPAFTHTCCWSEIWPDVLRPLPR